MRIGLSGAQSVGKTTIINALKVNDRLSYYVFATEVTRKVLGYGIPNVAINEGGNDLTQRLITLEVLAQTVLNKNVIMDRTLLDTFVYTRYLFENNNVSRDTYTFIKNAMLEIYPQYDHVFYIRPEFDIVDDGVRSLSKDYRDDIVNIFEDTINHYKLPITILSGSVENRIEQFLREI